MSTGFNSPEYLEATRPAREAQELAETEATQAARELWASFDDNEKAAVRFGMLPAPKVRKYEHIELRLLALALYKCAEQDGGMRA